MAETHSHFTPDPGVPRTFAGSITLDANGNATLIFPVAFNVPPIVTLGVDPNVGTVTEVPIASITATQVVFDALPAMANSIIYVTAIEPGSFD